jgi:hypothetical protein
MLTTDTVQPFPPDTVIGECPNPSGATAPKHQHQGSPGADLATCPPTGPGGQPTLQDMDDRPSDALPTLPPDEPPEQSGADGNENGACEGCPGKRMATGKGECHCLGPNPENIRDPSPGHPHGPSPDSNKPSATQTDVDISVNYGPEYCFHIGPGKPIPPTQGYHFSSPTALSIGQPPTPFQRPPLSPGTDSSQSSSHRPILIPVTANRSIFTDRFLADAPIPPIPPNLQDQVRAPPGAPFDIR